MCRFTKTKKVTVLSMAVDVTLSNRSELPTDYLYHILEAHSVGLSREIRLSTRLSVGESSDIH